MSPAGTPAEEKMVMSPAGDIGENVHVPAGENVVQPITDRSQVQPRPLTLFG